MSERVFGNVIPILTDEVFDNKEHEVHQKRQEGDVMARLQIMYHVATHMTDKSGMLVLAVEAMMLDGDDEDLPDAQYGDLTPSVISAALNEIMEAAEAALERVEDQKKEDFYADPHLTADGREPNAVLVLADGGAELIHLDGFVDSEDLGKPLDCDRVDMVLNKMSSWSFKQFGVSMAGYVDRNGIPKGLEENERIQSISGYDYIAGDCVLVGIDGKYNYRPLNPGDAVKVWEYFK